MSNVEMFKHYASQLNLTKPQLEAVTDCFKACFEADGTNGTGSYANEQQGNVNVGKKPTKFDDSAMPWPEETKNIFELPSYMKNRKRLGTGTKLDARTQANMNKMAANVRDGQYQNNVYQVDKIQKEDKAIAQQRQRVMKQQQALNQALGINIPVDGIMGPQTQAAMKKYEAMKAAQQQQQQQAQPAPQEQQTSNKPAPPPNVDWNKYHAGQSAGHSVK
ncbi:MAG: hypothetical protein IKN15_05525 [Bacteroidaceae bacterium]|nr:hypothetical protein [Bacteroidaceae bacterium]